MSKITEFAEQQKTNLAAISQTLDSIVAGIAHLDELIVAFQNSPGTLSPEDQAALDEIQAASATVRQKAEAISTAPPGSGAVIGS